MIEASAVKGGIVEQLGDASYSMVLRIGEIQRFELKHRGIFEVWDGFFQGGKKATTTEVHDLIALGLVGGGLDDAKADKIVSDLGAAGMLNLYLIASSLLGVAFLPDALDENGDVKKKTTGKSPKA